MNRTQRRVVTGLLLAGIVACCALMPWSRLFPRTSQPDEGLLTARIARYNELRRQDDWTTLYAMVDPEQRKVMPIARFLGLYGTGALKVHDLAEKSRQVDAKAGVASVSMRMEAEMVLARIDPRARSGLRSVDPKELRTQGEFTVDWIWRDGEWWLGLDREALTGRTSDGKTIQPAAQDKAPVGPPAKAGGQVR